MRGLKSILVLGTMACVLPAVGVAAKARSDRQAAVETPAPVVTAPVETDEDRRDQLNSRMQTMLREGKRSRLYDAPKIRVTAETRAAEIRTARPTRTRPSEARRPRSKPSRPEAVSTAAAGMETSTITPPAYRGGTIRTASGGRYVPPKLDLTTPPVVPSNPIECLTQAIYYEARNESEEGQAAVAEVVLNRSRAGGYPRDVCEVVYQRNSRTCQFTFTCDGSIGRSPINMAAWGRAERIARDVYNGRSQSLLPKTSVNYHADYVRPSWGRRLARVRQIGAHIFYGAPLGRGTTPGAEAAAPAPQQQGLIFVRNEALDRAYTLLQSGSEKSDDAG